jgi:hypothetical protein
LFFDGGGEEDPFAGGGGEEDPFAGGEEEIPAEEPEVEENIIELNGQSFKLVPLAEDGEEGFGDEEEFGGEDELDLESIIRELESELTEEDLGNGNPDDKDNAYSENGEYDIKEQSDSSDIGKGDNKVDVADAADEEDPEGGPGVEQNAMGESVTIGGKSYRLVEQEDDEEDDSVEESYDIDSSLFEGDDDDDEESVTEGEDEDEDDTVDEAVEDKDNAYDEKGDSGQENHGVGTPMGEAKELRQYKEAVRFLKDKLHEVNILNAKLLFTNKLFKEFALDNNQKLKVVETFDRTQSTREIKLVYSTLAEQFGDNGSIPNRKSINESASKYVASTRPSKKSRKVITEEDQVAKRFKKLAGIING